MGLRFWTLTNTLEARNQPQVNLREGGGGTRKRKPRNNLKTPEGRKIQLTKTKVWSNT